MTSIHAEPEIRAELSRRPAFGFVHGYILCSVLAGLNKVGLLDRLEEGGVRPEEAGENQWLVGATLRYLAQRDVVVLADGRYRLTPLGASLVRDKGYVLWIAGGFGEPFRRFDELYTHAAHYGQEVARDGRLVAISSAQLGKQDLLPDLMGLLRRVTFRRAADFGCGNAHFLISLCRDSDVRGVGIDISPEACAEAEQEVARAGLTERIQVVHADAADVTSLPDLSAVDLVVSFFFLHEAYALGHDAFVAYLRGLAERLPDGAHLLAAEITPQLGERANEELFAPEFTLIHAIMDQGLLRAEEWQAVLAEGGFVVRETVRPNLPGGLLILAQKAG